MVILKFSYWLELKTWRVYCVEEIRIELNWLNLLHLFKAKSVQGYFNHNGFHETLIKKLKGIRFGVRVDLKTLFL